MLVEGDETLMVTGEAAALSLTSAPVTLTITDDDSATVTLGAETVNEGVASGVVTITATLTGEVQDSFEVMVSTTDGTAKAGSDYTPTTTTLNFSGGTGAASRTATFTVPILDGRIVEDEEMFTVSLSRPSRHPVCDHSRQHRHHHNHR